MTNPSGSPIKEQLVTRLGVLCLSKDEIPVKNFAQQNSLQLFVPEELKTFTLPPNHGYDVAIVASFGHLIPSPLIASLPYGGINMHPSLLPKYRGAAPIYHTILNDERETGVSLIELHPTQFDAGRLLKQVHHAVRSDIMYSELANELAEVGAREVLAALRDYDSLSPLPQVQVSATAQPLPRAPKIYKESTQIAWNVKTPRQVVCMWRAFGDTHGVYTYYKGAKWKLFDLKEVDLGVTDGTAENSSGTAGSVRKLLTGNAAALYSPGEFVEDVRTKRLYIKCGGEKESGHVGWVECGRLQQPGKAIMDVVSFANGHLKNKERHGASTAERRFVFVPAAQK